MSEVVANKNKSVELLENDVIIATVGSWPTNPASVVGKTVRVPQAVSGGLLNQNAVRLRVKSNDKHDQIFLYYLLKNKDFADYIVSTAQGSANQASITLKDIFAYRVLVPPEKERAQIAKSIDALDKKIQLNRQTNQTLEAMAQALFKSWFVDFDPVIDNALAAGHEIPPELQARAEARKSLQARAEQRKASLSGDRPEQESGDILPESVRQLFPNRFVLDAQMGWIPEGWSKSTVADVSEKVFSGGTPNTRTSEYWNGNLNWFSSGETRNRLILETEKFITDAGVQNSSTKQSVSGDILIASAGQGHTRGQTSLNRINTYINQSVVCIRPASQKYSAWLFLNLHSRYEEMRGLSDSHSIRGSLTTKLLAGMKIVKPCDVLLAHFDQIVNDFIKKQSEAIRQILSLSKLRDTLLPKLISGELRLPESTSSAPQQETAAA